MNECKWPLQLRIAFGLEGHNSRQIMSVIGLGTNDQPVDTFTSEAATLSGNSNVREGGGFDLDREKVIDGENSRIQSDSSSSELE